MGQTYGLDLPSSKFFFEVRPEVAKVAEKAQSSTFLSLLWVTQEILKSLPPSPPWIPTRDRTTTIPRLANDPQLLSETTENTKLILQHTRLILSYQNFPRPTQIKVRSQRSWRLRKQRLNTMSVPIDDTSDRPNRDRMLKTIISDIRRIFSQRHGVRQSQPP
jgi:hypothetical protein